MDLHYSQTCEFVRVHVEQFHYLMDLHYSQTAADGLDTCQVFHYLMDLHYSQTRGFANGRIFSFTTLWIYTILKRQFANFSRI